MQGMSAKAQAGHQPAIIRKGGRDEDPMPLLGERSQWQNGWLQAAAVTKVAS